MQIFRSEQIMQEEMVLAVGSVLDKRIASRSEGITIFVSVIADEYTDISVHKQLTTYLLSVFECSGQGKTPSVTGEVIAKEIQSYLESTAQFDMNMFAGVSCDGASVTLGKHQGALTI